MAVQVLAMQPAFAQQATWTGPVNGSWFTAGNWSTGQVPNAATPVVIQAGQPILPDAGAQAASVAISGTTTLIVYDANFGSLSPITIAGAGPGSTFANPKTVFVLSGASSAGSATIDVVGAGLSVYADASVNFTGTSTASSATLSLANQVQMNFYNTSSAAQATISNTNSLLTFSNSASAGTAHITNNSGALALFLQTSSADTATIVNNAGGALDISSMTRSLGVGSLSGAGDVYLGARNLAVGGLGQDDAITGVIEDGISPELTAYVASGGIILPPATGGSLTKVGTGTLTLAGQNTYTGGTSLNGGVVQVAADANLGAATGPLSFNTGTLRTTADIAMSRATTLNAGGGTIETMAGTQLTQNGVIGGTGALTKTGAGTLALTAANVYAGTTTINAGSLTAGADNTLSANSAHAVAGGATLNLAGHNQTIAALSNAGTVSLGGAPGTVLNVSGDYTGAGGTLAINTTLNGDDSATDRLNVGGNTAGTTNVKVVNIGGAGAPTIEGIKIVDVGGLSNGTFSLQSDYLFRNKPTVVAGAYAYSLEKNGVSTPSDGDWYLRSSLNETAPPATPDAPALSASLTPTVGIDSGTFRPNIPVYQAGVPVYEAYPQILQALNELPTLRQRVGDRYNDKAELNFAQPSSDASTAAASDTPVWVRVIGNHGDFSPANTTSSTDYDLNTLGLQAGFDAPLYRDGNGSLVGGLTTHYESSSAHVSSVFGDGKIDAAGFGFGGALTWYGQDGFYVDTQGQLTWSDTDLSSNLASRALKDNSHGLGYALSIESGKRVPYTDQWAITPQAQLSYSAVDFDTFDDPFGARVSLDRGDSLRARFGVAFDYHDAWTDNAGKPSQVSFYAIPNFYYEFLDGTRVNVASTDVDSRNERLWTGLGLGTKCSWAGGKYSVFGEISANTSVSHFADSYTVKLDAGFDMAF